jgi:hypothetical protein
MPEYTNEVGYCKGNRWSQFYNYAKGWFKKSGDTAADLKRILSRYSGVPVEHLSLSDLNTVLLEIADYEIMKEKSMSFKEFVSKCSADGLIDACLDVMAFSQVGIRDIKLFRPDFYILPPNKDNGDWINRMDWAKE